MKHIKLLLLLILTAGLPTEKASAQTTSDKLPTWALGPFIRPAGVNPIISPNTSTTFLDPLSGKYVDWESNDTFNPAATVKGKEIVVLYRAEDKSGVGIGHRTSRLGYAYSTDGLTFKRKPEPVFYPGNDNQKE